MRNNRERERFFRILRVALMFRGLIGLIGIVLYIVALLCIFMGYR